MRRSLSLLFGGVACLIGVGLAARGYSASLWWASGGFVVAAVCRQAWLRTCLIVVSGFALGLWRGSCYLQKLSVYQDLWRRQTTLVVMASDDGIYGSHSQMSFTATQAEMLDGRRLAGSIIVSGFGVNSVMQGDELLVSGKPTPGLGSEQARISYARLSLIQAHPSLIANLRRKFTAGILSSLPEPEASFAMGLLIGQRASLPTYVKQDLLMVGLTHIIAVSGYNLTIILQASRKLFDNHSKRLATTVSLLLIGVFLLVAGNSASIVRAAIVSLLSIAAGYYGRAISPLLLLCLAADITAWARPSYVWHDASWYLSFMAFYGVMVVGPIIESRLPRLAGNSILVGVAIESLAAETMSLPYILHNFGQMSLVGLPANLLVTIFVPLAMLLSFIAGLFGWLLPLWCGWLSWPARWLLTYMLQIAHWLASLPHIFLQQLAFSTAQMLACYSVIICVSLALWYKTNGLKYVKLTDEVTKEPN